MSISYTTFELNCGYYFKISYKKDINLRSQSKKVDELLRKLHDQIMFYYKNFSHTQKLQQKVNDKNI